MNLKKQVDIFNASITRKAVIRYLTIVMDFSDACLKADLRPNRAIVMKDKISVSVSKFQSSDFEIKLCSICRGSSEASLSRIHSLRYRRWQRLRKALSFFQTL